MIPSPARSAVDIAVVALWRDRVGDRGGVGVEVVVARRSAGVHLGGLWEFPGGKCEPGETPALAASREAWEELEMTVDASLLTPLIVVEHDYGERRVRLHAFLGRAAGEPVRLGSTVSEWRWVPVAALASLAFPPANGPVTRAVVAALGAITSRDSS